MVEATFIVKDRRTARGVCGNGYVPPSQLETRPYENWTNNNNTTWFRDILLFKVYTVIILNIGTDRSEQTVQTQIRLLLMEQSDQGLLCLLFCLHLLNTILQCKI